MLTSAVAAAQQPSPAASPAGASPPATPAASPAGGQPPVHLVFIPYERLEGPQLTLDRSVLVPYAEFLRLRTGIDPTGAQRPRPVAALAQVRYRGRVDGAVARLDAELTIEAIGRDDDRMELSLPFAGAAIESLALEGAPATPAPLADQAGVGLIFQGPGRRTLRLRLAAPVRAEGALRILDLRAPRAGAASIELTLPDAAALESSADSLPAVWEDAPGGGGRIVASAGASDRIRLVWRPRAEAAAQAMPTRLAVDQTMQWRLTSAGAAGRLSIRATVLAGKAEQIEIALPPGVRLLSVAGAFVRDWSEPDAQGRVRIGLVRAVAEPFELTLDLQLDAPLAAGERVDLAPWRVTDAVQEVGEVAVEPDAALWLWIERADGLETAEMNAQAPPSARRYRFAQPTWALAVSRRPIAARLRAASLMLYEATESFVRLKTQHEITVRGRGIFGLTATAPEGYEVIDVGPQDRVVGYRQTGAQVTVNLRGEQQGTFVLQMTFQRAASTVGNRLDLRPVALDGVEEDVGFMLLALPPALRSTELESSAVEPADVRPLLERVQALRAPELLPTLAYRYYTAAASAAVMLERQQTRLTCRVDQRVAVTPSLMRIDAQLAYTIEFSATDTFTLLVPATVGEEVRFSGDDIKERRRTPAAAGEAWSTWTLRLQRRVMGAYALGVSFDVPLAQASSDAPLTVDVPTVRATGVARQTGNIGIVRGENLEVRVPEGGRSANLEVRDVKELPPTLAGAFLGFTYFSPDGLALRLEVVRHELQSVLGAVIRRMHIETVVSDQRQAVHEVTLEVQNNREQYLELDLAPGMEIWASFVRGTPVASTTRADGVRLIELIPSESLDTAFRVRLILRHDLGNKPMGAFGRLNLQPAVPRNMPILRTTWKLYLPPDFQYIAFGGRMRLETGGGATWLEPAADKLLTDLPARLVGGAAIPPPPPALVESGISYDSSETDAERQARLRAAAFEIPIVRTGKVYEFSKLSGVGPIRVSFWKHKPLLFVQALFALLALAWAVHSSRGGRPLAPAVRLTLMCFLLGGLLTGLLGRIFLSAFVGAGVATASRFLARTARRLSAATAKTPVPPPPPSPAGLQDSEG